jgi:hypothetical protein
LCDAWRAIRCLGHAGQRWSRGRRRSGVSTARHRADVVLRRPRRRRNLSAWLAACALVLTGRQNGTGLLVCSPRGSKAEQGRGRSPGQHSNRPLGPASATRPA